MTLQLLQDQGVNPEVILYLETPPDAAKLKSILNQLGRSPRELIRKGESEYAEHNLGNMALSDEQLIDAMVASPKLIERPIVLANGKAAVGRPPELVLEIL
jgi:arsenate reductase